MERRIYITRWVLFSIRYSRLFSIYFKEDGKNTDKPSIQIYVNKIENRITFKIKKRYSLELLTKETMKLLGSTENKITKDMDKMDKMYHILKLLK